MIAGYQKTKEQKKATGKVRDAKRAKRVKAEYSKKSVASEARDRGHAKIMKLVQRGIKRSK